MTQPPSNSMMATSSDSGIIDDDNATLQKSDALLSLNDLLTALNTQHNSEVKVLKEEMDQLRKALSETKEESYKWKMKLEGAEGELKQLLTQFSELRREIEKLGLIWTEKARPTVNNISNLIEQMASVAAILNLQTQRNTME